MFGIFKKKSEIDKLDAQYERLMKEAHRLSTSDRRASDAKAAEADKLLKRIAILENQEG